MPNYHKVEDLPKDRIRVSPTYGSIGDVRAMLLRASSLSNNDRVTVATDYIFADKKDEKEVIKVFNEVYGRCLEIDMDTTGRSADAMLVELTKRMGSIREEISKKEDALRAIGKLACYFESKKSY